MPPPPPLACPHRPPCGGCPLLALERHQQLERKHRRVRDALARFPALRRPEPEPTVPAPAPAGYRTRAKLAAAPSPDAARWDIGLFEPGSHRVVDIPRCLVLHPGLLPVLQTLRSLLPAAGLPLRHVDARISRSQGTIHLTLAADSAASRPAALRLAERLRNLHPELVGAALRRLPGGPTPRALAGRTEPLVGEATVIERLGNARFRLSPGAFFQADPAGAERLQQRVGAWLAGGLRPPRHLCDLYAGVGAFALALAHLAPRRTAVEPVPGAAEDARASARLSGLDLEVVPCSAGEYLARPPRPFPDRVIVDPPRRGLEPAVLRALALGRPERVAYVSCDPETLARDLDLLVASGFALHTVTPFDLFAQTAEVETVALLEALPAPLPPGRLWTGTDAVAVHKPAHLPTHPQQPGLPSLRDLVRADPELADLQPVHRLDSGTSGPLLFARKESLRSLAAAFARREVHKEYLALVRGIPRKSGKIRSLPEEGAERDPEETRYRLEEVVGGYGLLRLTPRTGTRHQIRRHLRRIGHPVLGDDRYGDPRTNRFLAETCTLNRTFLHLQRISFPSPDGSTVSLEDPLPPDLQLVLDRLRALRAQADPQSLDP